MGDKRVGKVNKLLGAKWGADSDDTCKSSILAQFIPPIIGTIVMGATGRQVQDVSPASLHPLAVDIANKIHSLRDATLDYRTPAGRRLQFFVEAIRREGDDLQASLRLQMNDAVVFEGRVTIRALFKRDQVAFTDGVVGTIELFYHHLFETALLESGEGRTEMIAGVARVEGAFSRRDVITEVLGGTLARNGREAHPGFDYTGLFGVFPDIGFHHFYGDGCRLADAPFAASAEFGR